MRAHGDCRQVTTPSLASGVVVAVFDNLSMKVDYSSFSTEGETGHKLDMTNWLSTTVPQHIPGDMMARSPTHGR